MESWSLFNPNISITEASTPFYEFRDHCGPLFLKLGALTVYLVYIYKYLINVKKYKCDSNDKQGFYSPA